MTSLTPSDQFYIYLSEPFEFGYVCWMGTEFGCYSQMQKLAAVSMYSSIFPIPLYNLSTFRFILFTFRQPVTYFTVSSVHIRILLFGHF